MARLLEREVTHVSALLLYAQLGVMDPNPTFCPLPPQLNIWPSLSRLYYTADALFNRKLMVFSCSFHHILTLYALKLAHISNQCLKNAILNTNVRPKSIIR